MHNKNTTTIVQKKKDDWNRLINQSIVCLTDLLINCVHLYFSFLIKSYSLWSTYFRNKLITINTGNVCLNTRALHCEKSIFKKVVNLTVAVIFLVNSINLLDNLIRDTITNKQFAAISNIRKEMKTSKYSWILLSKRF